jgi:hypothetical protein
MPNPAKVSGSQTKKNKGIFVSRKSSVNIINRENGRTRTKIYHLGNGAGAPLNTQESSNRDENDFVMDDGGIDEVTAIDSEVVAVVNQRQKTKVSVSLTFPTILTPLLVSE